MKRDELERQVLELLPKGYEPLLLEFSLDASRHHPGGIDIGTDYGTRLVVLHDTGVVISQPETNDLPVRYINSSIAALAACITAHEQVLGELSEESLEAQLRSAIATLRERLHASDPSALGNPENWWSVIIEQLEYELS